MELAPDVGDAQLLRPPGDVDGETHLLRGGYAIAAGLPVFFRPPRHALHLHRLGGIVQHSLAAERN